MNDLIVARYMRLLEPLSIEIKLELLAQLSTNLKRSLLPPKKQEPVDKIKLLHELAGSWKDMDDNVVDDIMQMRTISEREINLD
ncbi:MAG: hypothetical protein AB8G22_04380 [Saprospiraceae bacterium]